MPLPRVDDSIGVNSCGHRGICLTLPLLESLARGDESQPIRRLVCVANPFGMIPDAFFPTEVERDAALPENLQPLEGLRGQFTVFSNLDHGIGGGHAGTHTFLSGVRFNEAAGMPNGNITLDQFCGEATAGATRFPVINASAGSDSGGGCELSWTRSGVLVPPIQKVSRVFQMLFVDDPPGQGQERSARYDRQGSILDTVNDQAQAMQGRLSQSRSTEARPILYFDPRGGTQSAARAGLAGHARDPRSR